jgi:ubiquinone biosynthesis protein
MIRRKLNAHDRAMTDSRTTRLTMRGGPPPEANDSAAGTPDAAARVSTYRGVVRLALVLRVASRFGLLRAMRGRRAWPEPQRLRSALEELGVVYIKFGQVLALRRDVLPEAHVRELERLHDRLPAEEWPRIRATIEADLGQPVDAAFATIDETPLASASVAQVHTATLADNRPVVVKVRRTGLTGRIAEDLAVLAYVATMAEQAVPQLRVLDLTSMVGELRDSLSRELDLSLEAGTIARFRASLADEPTVWIPDVIAERSGEAVLTLEHSLGERIDVYARHHPEQRRQLATALAALLLRQVFDTGLFHADPHPGNLFVLPDGRLCLHDFGMVGELDARLREGLGDLLEAVVRGDERAAADAYLELGLLGRDADRDALEHDLAVLLRKVRDRPVAEVSVADTLQSLLRLGGQHRVKNPGPLLLLARALLITEALIRELNPDVNVLELFAGAVRRSTLRRLTPAALLADGEQLLRDGVRLLRDAPVEARRALTRLGDGELGRVSMPAMEATVHRASRGVERLTGAVVSGALLVTGGLLVLAGSWHLPVGDVLLTAGLVGSSATAIGALRAKRVS